ncbi:hypothetical protein VUR80DRAFT_3963 [Thermomyces stellatus]
MEHQRGTEKKAHGGQAPCRLHPEGQGVPGSSGGKCRNSNPAVDEPRACRDRMDARRTGTDERAGDSTAQGDPGRGGGYVPGGKENIVPEPLPASVPNPNGTRPQGEGCSAGTWRSEGCEDEVPEAPEDDPALTGPLGLRNDAEADEAFLKGVMEKLAAAEGMGRKDSEDEGG